MRRLRAFTLLELLIVIIILGVLAALIIPAISAARESAQQTAALEAARTEAESTTATISGVLLDIGTQHDPSSGMDLPIYKFKVEGQEGEEILANFEDGEVIGKTPVQVTQIHNALTVGKTYALTVYGHPNPYRNIRSAFHVPSPVPETKPETKTEPNAPGK
jgi:prepilin-type N-terminal cleavage/methylation domain-containing protein